MTLFLLLTVSALIAQTFSSTPIQIDPVLETISFQSQVFKCGEICDQCDKSCLYSDIPGLAGCLFQICPNLCDPCLPVIEIDAQDGTLGIPVFA